MSSTPLKAHSPTGSHENDTARADKHLPDTDADAAVDGEDDWVMDTKAKALTHLLKTSSVFVAIMAEKMRTQRDEAREAARREAARKEAEGQSHREAGKEADKMEKESSKLETPAAHTERRTRASARKPAAAPAAPDDTPPSKEAKGSGAPARRTTRGGKAQEPAKKKQSNIASYFSKPAGGAAAAAAGFDLAAADSQPTVQQALADAVDDDSNAVLGGGHELAATIQPAPVTGGRMRDYQLEGLEWLKTLYMNGLCGILADEMGLGKTVQAISMIAFLKENRVPGPFMIAAPLSTVGNWVDEFARWTPGIGTVLYHGSKGERAELRRRHMKVSAQREQDFPIICTSYEVCMNDRKFLSSYGWTYIIVDEGHRLKNMNCRLIKELLTYRSANRLLLTGTPLQNNIAELWSLLHFLLPDIFNDLTSFERWFDFSAVLDASDATTAERRKRSLVTSMHAILKPFLLRRVKTDVEGALPRKREYVLYAPLTAEQRELYREILNGTGRRFLEQKAVERLEARDGRAGTDGEAKAAGQGQKRKAADSATSSSRGKRRRRANYRELTDAEFDVKLRLIDAGTYESEGEEEPLSEEEQQEAERAANIRLAKQEIASKKLQNPVMQARLVCNSPHNFYWPWPPEAPQPDESLVRASGKLRLLDQLLSRLLAGGHKVLIFSQFRATLDVLESWASELRGWACCRLDGAMSPAERREAIAAFSRPSKPTNSNNKSPAAAASSSGAKWKVGGDHRSSDGNGNGNSEGDSDSDQPPSIFLLSTRAGGLGINLVAADTVILFDSDWNPQQDRQAMDRVHRIGQTRPVLVYRLATRGTVEAALLGRADAKRRLERLVIQRGHFRSLLEEEGTEERKGLDDDDGNRGGDVLHHYGQTNRQDPRAAAIDDDSNDINNNSNNDDDNDDVGPIFSEHDLDLLTDRSDGAFERAARGGEGACGDAFEVVDGVGSVQSGGDAER